MAILEGVGVTVIEFYQSFMAALPPWAQSFLGLFFISIVIVIYGILVWKFYRFAAKKDIIQLNLKKYNRSAHPFLSKTIAAGLYILEYMIILPFLVFFWFAVFTIFLILLTDNLELSKILLISATVIVAVRMTAYYKEDVSKEIAKLLPYTLLGVAIVSGGGFSMQKVLTQIFAFPSFFPHLASYLIFVFAMEFILRVLETSFVASGIEEEVPSMDPIQSM